MAKKGQNPTKESVTETEPEVTESMQDKMAREVGSVKPLAVAAIPIQNSDDGTGVERKDPRVELMREQSQMAMGYGKFEALLMGTTNLDHPVQANSLIHDMTELELFRVFGLPEAVYNIVSGKGMRSSGFFGFMRVRQAILYPPPDGIFIHPRMLLFSSQKKDKDELKPSQRGFLSRMLGGGDGQ